MTLTVKKAIDKIEVLERGIIQVREVTSVSDGTQEVARTYLRWVLTPGSDLSGQTDKVKAIATASWTPDVIAAYVASIPKE
jgi:hypothetical protein